MALLELWSTVLGLTELGVHDSFLDLGGHSVLAMHIVARGQDTWHIDIPLRSLLDVSMVVDMALMITQHLAMQTAAEELDCLLTALGTSPGDGPDHQRKIVFHDRSLIMTRWAPHESIERQRHLLPCEGYGISRHHQAVGKDIRHA